MSQSEAFSTMKPMAERYCRPDWVRRLNVMAESVGGDARRLVPIDADALLADAEHAAGAPAACDLGDPDWQDRFRQLAASIDASPMHVVGRLMSRQELARSLRTRFAVADAVARDPGVANEHVEAPVVVTGPARSGTTILFELLWLDPSLRAPLAYEALHPLAPAPETERAAWSECEQELWSDVQPEFAAMHELRSDLPVECVTLTMASFAGHHWPMIATLDGWMPDLAVMYDFHRRFLQVLQRGAARRSWLLKTPGHLATLELLFATYPDAWVVQTHRDPAKTMPSTASITATVQWMRTDRVDLATLVGGIDSVFTYALNHSVELRDGAAVPRRFVDVHFDRLLREPIETVAEAYAKMNRAFTDEHAERIRVYLRDKPKGKFGAHRYSPEDWGFSAAELRTKLTPYIDHFGVALED